MHAFREDTEQFRIPGDALDITFVHAHFGINKFIWLSQLMRYCRVKLLSNLHVSKLEGYMNIHEKVWWCMLSNHNWILCVMYYRLLLQYRNRPCHQSNQFSLGRPGWEVGVVSAACRPLLLMPRVPALIGGTSQPVQSSQPSQGSSVYATTAAHHLRAFTMPMKW